MITAVPVVRGRVGSSVVGVVFEDGEAVVDFSVVVELNPLSAINVPGLQHDVEQPGRDYVFFFYCWLVFVAEEPSGFTP